MGRAKNFYGPGRNRKKLFPLGPVMVTEFVPFSVDTARPLSVQEIAEFRLVFSWRTPLPVHDNTTCPLLEFTWIGSPTTTVR